MHHHYRKNAKWEWKEKNTDILKQLKPTLASNENLIHFDSDKARVIASNASNTDAVLSLWISESILKPIAFSTRSFSEVETGYSTIDKVALGLAYPLEHIFEVNRLTLKDSSNRLLQWTMSLISYNCPLQYDMI